MNQRGRIYEDKAAAFLISQGYRIEQKNFHTRVGEIDIVAETQGVISFIEVKARDYQGWVAAQETVNTFKQRKIIQTAKYYLGTRNISAFRFDVVAITIGKEWLEYKLFKNAFDSQE
jgi:putative endonuclease